MPATADRVRSVNVAASALALATVAVLAAALASIVDDDAGGDPEAEAWRALFAIAGLTVIVPLGLLAVAALVCGLVAKRAAFVLNIVLGALLLFPAMVAAGRGPLAVSILVPLVPMVALAAGIWGLRRSSVP